MATSRRSSRRTLTRARVLLPVFSGQQSRQLQVPVFSAADIRASVSDVVPAVWWVLCRGEFDRRLASVDQSHLSVQVWIRR